MNTIRIILFVCFFLFLFPLSFSSVINNPGIEWWAVVPAGNVTGFNCRFKNCFPLLSYNGTSSCGTYPSFTLLALRQVPSGRCEAGIYESPLIFSVAA